MTSSLSRSHNIKNDINFQTRNISASNFFMHIFNFFVTYEELILQIHRVCIFIIYSIYALVEN